MNENMLIAKIAHMYYYQGMDLKKIGNSFNVSYATISRLLKKGRDIGIIKVIIDGDFERSVLLEHKLKNSFNLKEVFSINVEKSYSEEAVLNMLGRETANYLVKKLKDGDKLGISWGRTVYNVVNSFFIKKKLDVDLIQLQGQIPGYNFEFSSLDLIRRLKNMFSGSYNYINTDAIVADKNTKEIIIKNSSAKDTFEVFKSLDLALMSVGAFNEDMIKNLFKDSMLPDEVTELKEHNIIGMNLFIFFDIHGNIYRGKFNDRIISIEAEDLMRIKNKVMVVSGKEKVPAIIGAMRAKLVDTLFIDSVTLEAVLSEIEE